MVKDKEELLDDLYALRAGLSVVSEEHDKMAQAGVEADKSIELSLSRRDDLGKRPCCVSHYRVHCLGQSNSFNGYSQEDEDRIKKGILKTWNKNGYTQSDYKNYYCLPLAKEKQKEATTSFDEKTGIIEKEIKRRKKVGAVLLVLTVILLVLDIYLVFLNPLLVIYPGIATIICFGFVCGNFVGARQSRLTDDKECQNLKFDIDCLNKIVAEYPAWEEKAKQIVFQMEVEVNPMIDKCENLLEVLRKTYSFTIDERDWQYLDLIIFYLETGRADNMKEALVLVEREVQTQRIIDKIEEATQRICMTIAAAAHRISRQLGVISAQLSVVTALQTVQLAQNSQMIKQIEFNNALIAKANTSSQKLMKDVAQVKSYYKK